MARLTFDLSALRVILIEDDAFAREQGTTALRHIGVKFLSVVEDGQKALDLLESGHHCDVIVSDWSMPNMDGLELLERIRDRWPKTVFLMATVNETDAHINRARQAGADGYLAKPFSLDKLRETLQAALTSRLKGHSLAARVDSEELASVLASVMDSLTFAGGDSVPGSSDAQQLSKKLITGISQLLATIDYANGDQLAVLRAYLACIEAASQTFDDVVISHETQNGIIDGLALAAHIAWSELTS